MNKWRCLLLLFFCFSGMELRAQYKNPLDSILYNDTSAVIRKVLSNPDKYRLQLIYSQTDYSSGNPVIKEYFFRHRPEEYFYPASIVKLPVAALALEKLATLKIEGVDKNTPLYTNPKYSGIISDTVIYPSLAENIIQMMVVSDNNAYNRVYDFLGQEYTHLRLFQKGYTSTRIIQRLTSATEEENRKSGPFKFVDTSGKVLYEEESLVTSKQFLNTSLNRKIGKAYFLGNKKIQRPKDFSTYNFSPLNDAHRMLVSIIYPEFIQPISRFELENDDYLLLRKAMSIYPCEAGIEAWTKDTNYYDCSRKYLYYGNYKGPADSNIRIFNKVGMAYGFMSDVAYFADYANKVEFFLSVVIYVNEDEVLNDGRYDYLSVGYPFLEKLGRLVYYYELSRDISCRNKNLVK